jgi:hypothetical protein
MKQIFHIFKKDVRRFWREIAISLAVLAVFTWIGPKLWRASSLRASYSPGGFLLPGTTETLLPLLISISWWLLITRVVHEERLVGDRQFWITRPYEWQKLLGAKTLIVAGSIYLPLAAAQCWLLTVAGLHPVSHVGALLYDWLLLAALPILPIAALAAVTRSFARMTLTLLGVLLACAAYAVLVVSLSQKGLLRSQVEYNDPLSIPVALLICATVIVIAYRSRRILAGRIMLLALPFLLILIFELLSSDAMVNRKYPEMGDAGIQFSLNDNAPALESAHVAISSRQLYIQIPLSASGIAPGDLWIGKGVRVTIGSGGQTLWVSSWQQLNFYLPTNGNTTLAFNVDRAVYDRVQSQPVTLRVEIALDQAHSEHVEASQVSLHDVEIPEIGVCSTIIDPRQPEIINGKPMPTIRGITCRSAWRDPQLTYVEAVLTRGLCQAAPGDGPSPTGVESAWIGNLNNEPAEMGITPVKVVPLIFSANWTFNSPDYRTSVFQHLCPGAPITFTRYGLVRQMRTEFTLNNFQFPTYDKREDEAR